MSIHLIETGYFLADGGAMFGAISKTAWSRRYPSNEANNCTLAMRSALVTTKDGHNILIDNGVGNKHLHILNNYQFSGLINLEEALAQQGFAQEEITDVVLTHLHFDHCGYTTRHDEVSGHLTLSFPNATHWVSQRQWENALHPNALEKDSYLAENMALVHESGLLRLIDKDTALCSQVELRLFDGHTPGQIVPYIHLPEQTFVFAGDVIPLVASVSPEWISAYDTFPVTSYQEKVRMLEEAVEKGQALIYCHDTYTRCSTIKRVNQYYKKDKVLNI